MDFGFDEFGKRTNQKEGNKSDASNKNESNENENEKERESTVSSSSSSFGDVEVIVGETGAQFIHVPLVASAESANPNESLSDSLLRLGTNSNAAMVKLLEEADTLGDFTETIGSHLSRNGSLVFVGALHHGKTSLAQLMCQDFSYQVSKEEEDRLISTRTHIMTSTIGAEQTSALVSTKIINIIDTPGHPQFFTETAAGIHLADVAILCVDAVESVNHFTEKLLEQVILVERLPVLLVITKVDRLILDLKLPPMDAYRKLRGTVDAVNNIISSFTTYMDKSFLVSPLNGTVYFASSKLGFFFSIETFSQKYSEVFPTVDYAVLSQKLWGQICYEEKRFKKISNPRQKPTFVTFILEPLYKIVSHSITGEGKCALASGLSALPRSPLEAVKEAILTFLGSSTNEIAASLLTTLPDPSERQNALKQKYLKDMNVVSGRLGQQRNLNEPFVGISTLTRIFQQGKVSAAIAVRVLSGTLRSGDAVCAIDNMSNPLNPYHEFKIEQIFHVLGGTYLKEIRCGFEGQIVYITGAPEGIGSQMLIFGEDVKIENQDKIQNREQLAAISRANLRPLHREQDFIHVSLELKDSSSTLVTEKGIQALMRSSPVLHAWREETGEFTLSGSGELYLDSVLYELRARHCSGVSFGVSKPFVSFRETIAEPEGVLAVAGARRSESFGFLAGKLSDQLVHDLLSEKIAIPFKGKAVSANETVLLWSTMKRSYGMDDLEVRNIIARGPDTTRGPSLLFDDLLPEETMFSPLTARHRQALISGFKNVVSRGPLVGEAVHGAGVKIIFADVQDSALKEAAVRSHAIYGVKEALLGAKPRLLEPVCMVEVLTYDSCIKSVEEVLLNRRGSIIRSEIVPATTFVRLTCYIPAIDIFGFESQLLESTNGQAFPVAEFSHWDIVPGDPFDQSIHVHPLTPAKGYQMARDFVQKTRFRKGLPPI